MDQLTMLVKAVALWAVLLMSAGCAGITPYDAPDYRDVPPGDGILTGEEGEFVIFRKADETEVGSEASKRLDESGNEEQQKTGNNKREKKKETKSGD